MTSGDERGARTSGTDPIRVDLLPLENLGGVPGRLGLTLAPGKEADGADGWWDRDLDADLDKLVEDYGAQVLVSLLEKSEYGDLGIPDLVGKAKERGVEVLRFPIPDGGVPREGEAGAHDYAAFVREVVERLEGGRTVVVHCRGGQGRSGLVAACVLVALGSPAVEALAVVREAREGAVETREQEDRVHFFEMELDKEGEKGA